LAEHLLARLAAVHGRPESTLSDAARKTLQAYEWPGNVRELKNTIERALVFATNSILEPSEFPDNVRTPAGALGGNLRSLEDIERDVIKSTLEATHYKISRSAEILGISRKTLLDKRKRYGLQ
jgi:DNA-binding NtrC family response regulator